MTRSRFKWSNSHLGELLSINISASVAIRVSSYVYVFCLALFFREEVEDEVPLRYRMGDFGDALAFTPHSPEYREVELAMGLFNPTSIEFHQVGDVKTPARPANVSSVLMKARRWYFDHGVQPGEPII